MRDCLFLRTIYLLCFVLITQVSLVSAQQTELVKYQFTDSNTNPDTPSIGNPQLTLSGLNFSGSFGNPFSSLYTNVNNNFIELTISTLGYKNITIEWDGGYFFGPDAGAHRWLLFADSGSGFGNYIYLQDCTRAWVRTPVQALSNLFDNNGSVKIRIMSSVTDGCYAYLDNLIVKGTKIDNIPPFFQTVQADISQTTDLGMCGAVVNYPIPEASDDQTLHMGAIPGFTYLGNIDAHQYYVSSSQATATSAIQNAEDLGGHLVTIGSQLENDFVNSNTRFRIWIGLSDVDVENDFRWITNEAVSYTNWNGHEPNDYGTGEDYTEMRATGMWNDLKESSTLRYVVEFQPVVVIQTSGLPPGSIFPVGITTNTFVATDRSGNTTTQIFNVTVVDNTPPAISDLKASYYEGRNFETFMETKDVQELNYNWGTGAPESSLVGVNDFSVRFRGSIKAPQTGLYTFYTTSDDGVRLWVDGTSVVDNWTDHGRTVNTGTLNLIAGEYVPIILDYYENGGGAIIQLEWEGPGLTREYVKNQGLGSCLDLSLDLGSTGMRTITPAEIDPGYIDACGVSSRVLSKTEFTCNDSGDNPVRLTVTDVNGNQASCHVNIKIIGTPDNSLSVLGETLCEGNSADVIVKSSEVGVTYTLYIDSNQVSTSVIGTGVDISLNIPSSSLQVGTNLVIVRASRGACELNLQNTATVNINPKPKPKDISFD